MSPFGIDPALCVRGMYSLNGGVPPRPFPNAASDVGSIALIPSCGFGEGSELQTIPPPLRFHLPLTRTRDRGTKSNPANKFLSRCKTHLQKCIKHVEAGAFN